MNTVIVCSLNDPAGVNIRDRLIETYPFKATNKTFDSHPIYSWEDKHIVSSSKDIVFVDGLDEVFGRCNYVFVSRHRAESGIPSLTAHFTGNFGHATFGGNPHEVARYSPNVLKNYMLELNALRHEVEQGYEVTLEATHHGPTNLQSPVVFIELGSTEKQWGDRQAARAIARALISCLDSPRIYRKCAIGIGGTHYPQKLNKIETDSDIAIGAIVPKYALEHLDKALLEQVLTKSEQRIGQVVVDYKGLGGFKRKVNELLDEVELEVVSA